MYLSATGAPGPATILYCFSRSDYSSVFKLDLAFSEVRTPAGGLLGRSTDAGGHIMMHDDESARLVVEPSVRRSPINYFLALPTRPIGSSCPPLARPRRGPK